MQYLMILDCLKIVTNRITQIYFAWSSVTVRRPYTISDTHKVAAFCFVLLMLVCNSLKKNICMLGVFCSFLPHLSLGWAYRTPRAIGASTAAPKPEIPLKLLGFALSAFWCQHVTLPWRYRYLERFFALSSFILDVDGHISYLRPQKCLENGSYAFLCASFDSYITGSVKISSFLLSFWPIYPPFMSYRLLVR